MERILEGTMTFEEFEKGFIYKEHKGEEGSKSVWIVKEKGGTYQASGLEKRSAEWELRRCFESRKISGKIN
jgi:hypothetical protein